MEKRQDSPSRSNRRKLTSFLCREMLYDYATNRLDSERRLDVDAFLKEDISSREVLTVIQRGLECSEELAQTQLDPEVFKRLGESENARTLVHHAARWSNWPESLRWSILALGISAATALLIAYIPWSKLPSFSIKKNQTIVLADIPKDQTVNEAAEVATEDSAENDEAENAGEDTSGDEHEAPGDAQVAATIAKQEAKAQAQAAVAATSSVPQKPVEAKPVPQVAVAPTPAPNVAAVQDVRTIRGNKQTVPEAATTVAKTEADETGSDAQTETSKSSATDKGGAKKPRGFVYRAFMNLSDVQGQTPEIVEKLQAMDAQKAGEVPLGWRRGEGSYFHFTVPEANQESMLEMLRAYGPVRISKDPHPRIMPEGQIRIILWIEPSH